MMNRRKFWDRTGLLSLSALAVSSGMVVACAQDTGAPSTQTVGGSVDNSQMTAPGGSENSNTANNGGTTQDGTSTSNGGSPGIGGTNGASSTNTSNSNGSGGQPSSTSSDTVTGGTSATSTPPSTGGQTPASTSSATTGGATNTGSGGFDFGSFGGFNFGQGGSTATNSPTGGTTAASSTAVGGNSATGGNASTATTDPDAAAAISSCIDKMDWGQNNIKDRDKLIDVIMKTCVEFAPAGAEWQTYCQMFLVGAMVTESSFNADLVVEDAYGGSSDPTVGLTQVRYSSTVKDFVNQGNMAALERIGCTLLGSANPNDSGSQHLDLMKDVACNVGLGTWYYFLYATGNGGSSVVYLSQYCSGKGVGGTLVTGMLSHQLGPSSAVGASPNDYVNNIKKRFDKCITVSGTHPFDLKLEPNTAQFCK